MQQQHTPDFIVIDDDFINNVICQQVIKNELPETKIMIYTNSQQALEYIDATYSVSGANKVVLLLDINMPALNGWDILDQLEDASGEVKHYLKVFLLSSSVTPEDKQKAAINHLVCGYIEKPLTQAKFNEFFPDYAKSKRCVLAD